MNPKQVESLNSPLPYKTHHPNPQTSSHSPQLSLTPTPIPLHPHKKHVPKKCGKYDYFDLDMFIDFDWTDSCTSRD